MILNSNDKNTRDESPNSDEAGQGQTRDAKDWRALTEEQWQGYLDEERFYILRKAGTEQAFSGEYCDNKTQGVYHCAACGDALFNSESKYDSGTGWPSFDRPANADCVEELHDSSHGMNRVEVRCKRCASHMGHVFEDGPTVTTGRRYCINSKSLKFKKSARDTT